MDIAVTLAFRRKIFLVLGLIVFSLPAPGMQRQEQDRFDKAEMREMIAAIIRERLTGAVTVVNGIRAETRTPPSPEAIKTIRQFGDNAVPVLANYLRSDNPRERAAAIEFLGLLGGRRIVSPLQKVINSEVEPYLRVLALRWITTAPPEFTLEIIRKAAKSDSDREVREAAQSILSSSPSK